MEWDDSGFEHINTEQLFTRMREDLKKPGLSQRTGGDFESTFQKSEKKIEAVYETPYESHSCMEPLNCIAHVHDDKCEIWGPIQGPDWIQGDISEKLGLKPENVTVNMTFLGGGFGRKAFTDYPYEAAIISKEIKAPVQVVWTREDDMTQGPFLVWAAYSAKPDSAMLERSPLFRQKWLRKIWTINGLVQIRLRLTAAQLKVSWKDILNHFSITVFLIFLRNQIYP